MKAVTAARASAWDRKTAVEQLASCERNVDALKRLLLQLLANTAADPIFSVAFGSTVTQMEADRKCVRQHLDELADLQRDDTEVARAAQSYAAAGASLGRLSRQTFSERGQKLAEPARLLLLAIARAWDAAA